MRDKGNKFLKMHWYVQNRETQQAVQDHRFSHSLNHFISSEVRAKGNLYCRA